MAISNNDKIQIIIDLDNKGAIKNVQQLGGEINNLANKEVKKAESSFINLGNVIRTVVAGATVKMAGDFLQLGSSTEGLTRSFNDLQASAGVLGNESLAKLREATSGLVSDLELMKISNQAVLLGLPVEGFDKMAEAATKLGLATGRTATEAMTDLVTGVGRASKLILDNLGIIVNTEQAYTSYAKSINTTTDALTDQQKTLAFQAAAYDAINKKAKELQNIQLDAGSAVTKIEVAFKNLSVEVAKAFNANTDLANSLSKLADNFRNLEIQGAITLLAQFTSAIVDATNQIISLVNTAVSGFNEIALAIPNIYNSTLLGELAKQTEEATAQTKVFVEQAKKLGQEQGAKELAIAIEATKNEQTRLNQEFKNGVSELTSLQNKLNEIKSNRLELGTRKSGQEASLTKEISELETRLAPLAEQVNRVSKELSILISGENSLKTFKGEVAGGTVKVTKEIESAFKNLKSTLEGLTGTTGIEQYKNQIDQLANKFDTGKISADDFKDAIGEIAKNAKLSAEQIGLLGGSVQDSFKKIDQAKEEALRESERALEDAKRKAEQLSGAIEQNLANGISQGLEALSTGGSFDATLENLGASMGATLGASIGGPIGAAIGDALGRQMGEGLGKLGENKKSTWEGIGQLLSPAQGLFGNPLGKALSKAFGGGRDAGTQARKDFISEINKLSGENLQVLGSNNLWAGFDGMSADVVASFSSIGEAIAKVLGITEDLGGQFGSLLAYNVGSLNELQLLINKTGISAEQMQEQIKDAWLAGDSSAVEALTTLQKIQQVTTQGIPDGIGLIGTAFDNLKNSGGEGARVIDALGDIAVETKEKGIASLDGAIQDLIASGKDAKEVEKVFSAIKNAGISSLNELQNISVDAAMQIAAALENTPDFFAEKAAKLEDIKQKLREIESKEVDIKFNFKSSLDQNTQTAINSGAFASAGIPNIGGAGL